jgi:hypothetical protein
MQPAEEIAMSKPWVSKLATLALAATFTVGLAGAAHANWAQSHPRRAEVNGRLNHQSARINHEFRDGQISWRRAQALHHQDHQIRQEERLMASQDGSHITRAEQGVLNQQENHVSREIGW